MKTHSSITEHQKLIDIYNEQIKLYGSDGELEYKPFSLLKIIYKDGEVIKETIPIKNNIEFKFDGENDLFHFVSDDKYLVLDLDLNTLEDCQKSARAYFDMITITEKMEGIVIKTNNYHSKIPACMKVRNKNYLTIIYGYDYLLPYKHQHLMKQKNINGKVKLSIKEYELGLQMLTTKYEEIDNNNKEYRKLIATFLFHEEKAKDIDPRL